MTGFILNSVFALICFAFSVRHFLHRGMPLNNSVLGMPTEAVRKMDLAPYYRQTGTVFLMLGIMNMLYAFSNLLSLDWLFYAGCAFAVLTGIYAVVSSVRMERSKK